MVNPIANTRGEVLAQRDVEIIWTEPVVEELRDAVSIHITRLLWLVPRWCREIHVITKPVMCAEDDPDQPTRSEITTSSEYGWAKLMIRPVFFELSERERWKTLVHEFCHLPLAPIIDYQDVIVQSMDADEDSPQWKALEMERTRRLEEAVSDLECAVVRYMDFNGDRE